MEAFQCRSPRRWARCCCYWMWWPWRCGPASSPACTGELQLLLVAATAGPVISSGEDEEGVRGCAPAPDQAVVGSTAPTATALDVGGGVGGSGSRLRWRHGSASGTGSGGEVDEEGKVVARGAGGWEVAGAAAGSRVGLGFHWVGFTGARGPVSGVGRGGEVDEEGGGGGGGAGTAASGVVGTLTVRVGDA